MIGLKNNIYNTLFPHLRKSPLADGTRADAPALIDEQPDDALMSPDAAPMDYASAAEMQNQINYDNTIAPEIAAATPDFDPNDFSSPKATIAQGIAQVPLPALDTTNLERTITKTPYQTAKENAENVAAEPIKKQDAWKQALWIALQGANKFFNPQDNTPIQWLGEAKHGKKVAAANAQLAPLEVIEQRKIKQAQEMAKLQKSNADFQAVMLGNEGKVISNASARGKQAYETLQKKDFITPEEAADYKAAYGIEIVPYDARTFKTEYRNGIPLSAPTKGQPNFRVNETLPVEKRNMEVPVTIGDQKGYATSKEGLNMKVAAETGNINRSVRVAENQQRIEERQQERTYASQKEYNNDLQSWQKQVSQANAKVAGATKELQALESLKAANKDYDTTAIDAKIAAKIGEIAEAQAAANIPKPKANILPQYVKRADAGKTIKIPKNDPMGLYK